ncbi:MAG: histone deacetylase family protein [Rhodospirillales bacterium]|nr:histone deacetylase family protein [Rhodospirillales bacterium]
MTTLLYTHPICVEHSNGRGHPESPDRLRVIDRILAGDAFNNLERKEAPLGSVEQVKLMHNPRHVDAILENVPGEGGFYQIDGDTGMCDATGKASMRAVGALCEAVDQVMVGEADNAFCAMRPPGHHAERTRSMGFCIFNSVAIAAEHARQQHGAERIAVIDFDVHHGNGTQDIFEQDKNLFYASTHQSPCYPGTGDKSETGIADNIVNAPLRPGAGSETFKEAMRDIVLPKLKNFHPDLIMISAGFDAHRADPLAQLQFETEDFAWATDALMEVAEHCCHGRVVSALEGGYDLTALGESVGVHVETLMGR